MISRKRDRYGRFLTIHGMSNSPEHVIWQGIHQRCYDSNSPAYKNYGGRGIKMCGRWRRSFQSFLDDVGERPLGKSLDRIDNDGDYSPENCRWATNREQANNSRHNHPVTIDGVTKNISQWIDMVDIKRSTVKQRFYVYGWSLEEALGFVERRIAP